jgi:multidrug efflux pump subunit AcrA (membrane-fusion protein)
MDDHQLDLVNEKGNEKELAIKSVDKGRNPWTWSVVGAMAIALLVFAGFRVIGGPVETDGPEATPVATSEIQVRDLAESREYTGQLQYDDAMAVAASGSGYLTGLVEDGDTVERGDVVYRLSNDPQEAELLSAQQQEASAEANLAAAEARRAELPDGASAADRRQAAATVDSARIALEISRLQLSDLVAAPTAVSLFYGEEISWRTLAMGSSPGSDIRQLEENLAALGFDPDSAMVVDDIFDEATEQAIMRWEESLVTTVDGSVAASDLVYSPGPAKAGPAAEGVELGMAVNAGALLLDLVPVSRVALDLTGSESIESTQKIVLQLPVDDRDLIEEGSAVVVELADGSELDAVITTIGAPVTSESGSTVEVLVVPIEAIDDMWTGTNVTVHVTSDLAQQVLTVPVSALLALVEGGYAVEVVGAGDSTRLVSVETGMFADGVVEISGEGLSEGLKVVVPG